MKRLFKILPIVAILVSGIVSQPLWADTVSNTVSLEQRLDALEQQVAELKQELQQQKQQAAQNARQATISQAANLITAQTPPAAYVTANSKDGFSIKSVNGEYSLSIGVYTQLEAREFGSNNKEDVGYDEDSEILLRRARLIIQGTIARDFDYYLQPDFGYNNAFSTVTSTAPSAYSPALQDAWIDYKYFPWATIKVGKMKTPFDLENLQDSRYTSFTEVGLTGNLSPQRDLGAQVGGRLWNNRITYAVGIYDGAADHENPYGGSTTPQYNANNRSGTGRIFVTPFKGTSIDVLSGLGIGYAESYGKEKGPDLPSYVTTGQAPFFSYTTSGVTAAGPQYRGEPQAYYYYKSLGLLAEAVESQEELQYTSGGHVIRTSPDNKSYELTGTYVLTGENASYNGVTPKNDLNPSLGHWGAFELAARYGELKIDHSVFDDGFASLSTSASEARAWATGINWYLNKNAKVVFDYEQTKFRRGAPAGVNDGNRKTENLFTTMFQLSL